MVLIHFRTSELYMGISLVLYSYIPLCGKRIRVLKKHEMAQEIDTINKMVMDIGNDTKTFTSTYGPGLSVNIMQE